MPGFNIENFYSQISQKEGVMRTNKFLVVFPTPQVMLDSVGVARDLEFWCESTNFPGYLLTTHGVRRYTYGPVEKRVFGPNFTQLQCLFNNDTDSIIHSYFSTWMSRIMPHDTRNGMRTVINGMSPYEVEYRQNYITDLHLFVYDESGNQRTKIVCKEAFPSQLVDVPLSWADTNNVFKFQVAFDFTDWYIEGE